MKKEAIHCCGEMFRYLDDPQVPLKYFPITREYGLEIPSTNYPIEKKNGFLVRYSSEIQILLHCPWCGVRFWGELRDRYFEELEKMGIDADEINKKNNPFIPGEFKSEEWWRLEKIYMLR